MDERDVTNGREATEETWSRWMRAALDGDARAYRDLLGALTPRLRGLVGRALARAGASTADLEDIVQETLLALHLKRHTWEPTAPLAPWVQAIARNKTIDALRRRGRRIEVDVADFAEFLPAAPDRDPTEGGDVERLLGELGDRQRDIVRSIGVEEKSVRETADRLGMSEGAVRVALHRGLKTLADLYRRSVP